MATDINYALHYARWHRNDEAYFQEWHRSHAGQWEELVGSDKSQRILDIGCGFGLSVYSLRASGYGNAEGVDVDANQIKVAKERGLPCQLVAPSADDPFYEAHVGAFDTIMMYDLLEHVPKDAQMPFLRGVRRCLRPNGQLILRVPNALGPAANYQRYIDHTHYCSFTIESLDFVLVNSGFLPGENIPYSDLRFRDNWHSPWRMLRMGLVVTTRALWKAVYVGELGKDALKFPMTRDLLVRTRLAAS